MTQNIKLYEFLRKIPKWKVISYKTLGKLFDMHPRSVARLLSENKEQEKFPCFKVVNCDGKVWWYNLWQSQKIKLLKNDWVQIVDDKIVNSCFWDIST